jgi:hypothetical protein
MGNNFLLAASGQALGQQNQARRPKGSVVTGLKKRRSRQKEPD